MDASLIKTLHSTTQSGEEISPIEMRRILRKVSESHMCIFISMPTDQKHRWRTHDHQLTNQRSKAVTEISNIWDELEVLAFQVLNKTTINLRYFALQRNSALLMWR